MGNSKKLLAYWIVGLAVIFSAVFVIYKYYKTGNTQKSPSASLGETTKADADKDRASLNKLTKFIFPKIIAETDSTIAKLPDSMKFIISNESNLITVKALVFENNKSGYKAIFRHNEELFPTQEYFRNIIRSNYDFIESIRGYHVGVLMVQNSGAIFRIELTRVNEQATDVIVIMLKK